MISNGVKSLGIGFLYNQHSLVFLRTLLVNFTRCVGFSGNLIIYLKPILNVPFEQLLFSTQVYVTFDS